MTMRIEGKSAFGSTAALLSALLLGMASAGQSAPGDDTETSLARLRESQRSLRTLSAVVEQRKSFPQLGIEDPPERGRLYLSRDAKGDTKIRIQIDSPDTRVLIVQNGRYLLYQPRIKQVVEGPYGAGSKGNGNALFTAMLTGSEGATEALERDYRLETVAPGRLRFDARESVSVHCRIIELWIDEVTGLPRKQSCHQANRSVITMTLDDIEVDGDLPEGVFDLDIPRDVERVKS